MTNDMRNMITVIIALPAIPLSHAQRTIFLRNHLLSFLRRLEKGTKPMLTPPHDVRRYFGLSRIRTCDHPHASPAL